jgi:predicted ArsR family transcriptional regulator
MDELEKRPRLEGSRGRVVALLKTGGRTAEEIANSLGVTRSAVRLQMAAMEREGLVRRAGKRPGVTRPSLVFELTATAEQLLSKAYIPLLVQLVEVVADTLPPRQLDSVLRRTGRKLAGKLLRGERPGGSLRSRVGKASEILNEQLGAATRVESNGRYVIRGAGCPITALTGQYPGVCRAVESLLTEIVGAPVTECCDRGEHPRCCFEIPKPTTARQ